MTDRTDILVRAPNWIGDAVMSTSFLAALRRRSPDAAVTLLAHARVEPVFRHNPAVGRTVAFGARGGLWRASLGLRRERFAEAWVLPLSFSSALSAWLAGAGRRAGYGSERRAFLLTDAPAFDQRAFRSRHLVEDYLALLGPAAAVPPPEVFLLEDEIAWAQRWLAGRGLEGGEVVGFGPGATYGPAKRWPSDRWIELGRRLKQRGARVLVFGSFAESRECKEIERNIGTTAVSLAGGMDLRQSAALIAHCRAFVTNDTGVMHLAAAVGTPVVALFGSTNPSWTGPWGGRHAVLSTHQPCSPCYARSCRFGHYDCLRDLSVDRVLAALG
ncbi:MAG: lipopolysaccharide heptosyltransferase II [Candidatus Edwardsbacteria bacterium]|nr:lipopolysaccharide heptosyltransferase II [Candidatus Edwardsbacteria bacterium]